MAEENENNQNNPNLSKEEQAKQHLLGDLETVSQNIQNTNKAVEEIADTAKVITNLGKIETEESSKFKRAEAEFNKITAANNNSPELDFRDILPNAIPSKSLYYEINRLHQVRSCSTPEIKHYSGMKESDVYDIEAKVNELIDACTKVHLGNGRMGNYRDLSLYDKIFILFAIRDLTLLKRNQENKLFHVVTNPKNGETKKIEINKDCFEYYQIPNGITKWYDEMERGFVIKSEAFGKDPLKIYIPTIGVTEKITEYIKWKQQQQKSGGDGFIDEQFLQYSQFLIKDWRQMGDTMEEINTFMNNMRRDYAGWNEDKHMTMVKVANKLDYGVKPTVTVEFEEGVKVSTPVTFPNFRSLFDFSSVSDELLSD